jgi:hypothetical protein
MERQTSGEKNKIKPNKYQRKQTQKTKDDLHFLPHLGIFCLYSKSRKHIDIRRV